MSSSIGLGLSVVHYFRIWAKDDYPANWSIMSSTTACFNSPFSFETVPDPVASVGDFTSIAIDKDGNLHVSYRDITNGALRYIKRTGSGWDSPMTVDNSPNVGLYNSIAIDGNGNPHISYYDGTNTALKYAMCICT